MSLTNPNTPVSQQDLQDFYHKLLPYMGGSFGLVATGINSANLYSTTERVIGQWIDGKPLYQKTITGLSVTPTYNNWTLVSSVSDLDIDMLIGVFPINISQNILLYMQHNGMEFRILNGNLDAEYLQNIARREINVVTLQYTKTTDSAVELYGTDTTYSTDEHVVGSWIDGRPVYQKTITGTAPTGSSTQNIQIGANVENALVISGYCQHDSFLTPINVQVDTNEYLMVWVRNNSHPTVPNTLGIKAGSALYGGSYNITLQYTKPSSS